MRPLNLEAPEKSPVGWVWLIDLVIEEFILLLSVFPLRTRSNLVREMRILMKFVSLLKKDSAGYYNGDISAGTDLICGNRSLRAGSFLAHPKWLKLRHS
jgi:hypothetical protein